MRGCGQAERERVCERGPGGLEALGPWWLGMCGAEGGAQEAVCARRRSQTDCQTGQRMAEKSGFLSRRKIQGVLWVAPGCVVDNATRFLSLGLGAKKCQGTRSEENGESIGLVRPCAESGFACSPVRIVAGSATAGSRVSCNQKESATDARPRSTQGPPREKKATGAGGGEREERARQPKARRNWTEQPLAHPFSVGHGARTR